MHYVFKTGQNTVSYFTCIGVRLVRSINIFWVKDSRLTWWFSCILADNTQLHYPAVFYTSDLSTHRIRASSGSSCFIHVPEVLSQSKTNSTNSRRMSFLRIRIWLPVLSLYFPHWLFSYTRFISKSLSHCYSLGNTNQPYLKILKVMCLLQLLLPRCGLAQHIYCQCRISGGEISKQVVWEMASFLLTLSQTSDM